MEYRYLGASGLQISALSFGSWLTFGKQVDLQTARDCLHAAYDAGVNFFDNAEVYADGKSEEVMGELLKKTGWGRDTYLVSTKIFWAGEGPNQRGLSRKHIVEGTHAALKRLQLDYVDLIYCHRPDFHTPVEETVRAMNHIIAQGKALYWGTSEWPAERIVAAHSIARREHLIPPLMEQPQYNMFHRHRFEQEYARLYQEFGMGSTIWSPLAGGLLTGKYNQGIPPNTRANLKDMQWLRSRYEGAEATANIEKVTLLGQVAQDLGCSVAQLALAWCLKNPHVSSAILGASRVEQLHENLGAVDVTDRLTEEVMLGIDGILDNSPPPEPDMR